METEGSWDGRVMQSTCGRRPGWERVNPESLPPPIERKRALVKVTSEGDLLSTRYNSKDPPLVCFVSGATSFANTFLVCKHMVEEQS